eukprot:3941051-Rhodomonas_salina.2
MVLPGGVVLADIELGLRAVGGGEIEDGTWADRAPGTTRPRVLRVRYQMSGTDVGRAATKATGRAWTL